jgi:hypothetical protein
MKRTKRISIEFQHREVKIVVSNSTANRQADESEAASAPAVCPVCGSPWMTLVACADGDVAASANSIHRALEQYGLHLHLTAAGQLSICRKSLEAAKERH